MDDNECSGEDEDMKSEDEIDDISQDADVGELKQDYKDTNPKDDIKHETFLGHEIPTIKLFEISEKQKICEMSVDNFSNDKSSEEYLSVELAPTVVSSSHITLEKKDPNIDIEVTNNDSLLDPNLYCNNAHSIERSLQKSDSQTSGYDSSLSLSETK